MRFVISFFLILILLFPSTPAFSENSGVEINNKSITQTTGTYNESCQCHLELPLEGQQLKKICETLSQSEVCQRVKEKDRIKCDGIEPQFKRDLWEFLKGCAVGVFDSIKSILNFIWEIMKWAWDNATSEKTRDSNIEAAGEYANIVKLYLHTEFEKAYAKQSPPLQMMKALKAISGTVAQLVVNQISDMIAKEKQEFYCLNFEAKSKKLCEVIGDVFIPPAAAISLLKYGPKAFKRFPNLEKAFEKIRGGEKAEHKKSSQSADVASATAINSSTSFWKTARKANVDVVINKASTTLKWSKAESEEVLKIIDSTPKKIQQKLILKFKKQSAAETINDLRDMKDLMRINPSCR
ncbi:MAG: hypothetical protein ACXVCP_09250 [Bdellovibrio sp.]